MALNTTLTLKNLVLDKTEERRIRRHLEQLERRLVHHPDPEATLVLESFPARRQVEVDLRVQLGPLGSHLISHQVAETPDHAVRLAVEDVERQLERRLAQQRGEPTYGVPSRRLPETLRPATERAAEEVAEEEQEGTGEA